MHIVSVNVGHPRQVADGDHTVTTAIWKSPQEGKVPVGRYNLRGDRQADRVHHGGPDKAVYAYPVAHYASWCSELPGVALPWGAFGENLTIDGIDEATLGIGDCLRAGTALLMVTMPRVPCAKLGLRVGRPDMAERMGANGRCGSYLRVVEEGEVAAGDAVVRVALGTFGISVAELFGLIMSPSEDRRLLRIASKLPTIPEVARQRFARRLEAAADEPF